MKAEEDKEAIEARSRKRVQRGEGNVEKVQSVNQKMAPKRGNILTLDFVEEQVVSL